MTQKNKLSIPERHCVNCENLSLSANQNPCLECITNPDYPMTLINWTEKVK